MSKRDPLDLGKMKVGLKKSPGIFYERRRGEQIVCIEAVPVVWVRA